MLKQETIMPAKNKQKNNKRSSSNSKAANGKPRSRGVLIQRDVPYLEKESPFVNNLQAREMCVARSIMARQPSGTLSPRGVWREFKFSTYYSTEGGNSAVTSKIQELESLYCEGCRSKNWLNISTVAPQLVRFTTTVDSGDNQWRYAQYRYDKLLFLDSQYPEYASWLVTGSGMYLADMVRDEKEDPFFRAYAAHLLARNVHFYLMYCQELPQDEATKWKNKKDQLDFILKFVKCSKEVSSLHRSRILQRYETNISVGQILDQISEAWEVDIADLQDYVALQPEVHEELKSSRRKCVRWRSRKCSLNRLLSTAEPLSLLPAFLNAKGTILWSN